MCTVVSWAQASQHNKSHLYASLHGCHLQQASLYEKANIIIYKGTDASVNYLAKLAPHCLLLCFYRHDEQAAHLGSVTDQFGNTQQALQELQAEFADQSHERIDLQAQLASFNALHAELQALDKVQAAELLKLNQQLSTVQASNQDLQVLLS